MPDDYYVSKYSGEEIDERLTAAHNAVRYDAAQTLTDAKKMQARNNISAMQGIESTDHPGCYYVLNGSTVEWVNPPMYIGVEYRTTERYDGKPVYVKLVDCGVMANNKNVSIVTASYRAIDVILRGNPTLFPMVPENTRLSGWQGGFYSNGETITLYAGQDLADANHPVTAIVKFVKA